VTLGTHVAFASVLYLGGATLFGYPPDAIGWVLAAAASVLPDLDLPPSKIGRLFWFVSVPLGRRFGHRTLWIFTVHGRYLMVRYLPAGPARVSPYRALP